MVGGLDPSSILKLEEEKRQRIREEELLKLQEKHLLVLLSREDASIAKQSLLVDVKQHAESVRKEVFVLYFFKSRTNIVNVYLCRAIVGKVIY